MSDPFAAKIREAAKSALPVGAFLRRDRGEALFVTDAPRRLQKSDWTAPGFDCTIEKGLAFLTPGPAWLHALEAAYPTPPDHLCATLMRFRGTPSPDALRLFAMGVKRLDGGPHDAAFERKLRQLAAVSLRKHDHCGGLYACALLRYKIEEERST